MGKSPLFRSGWGEAKYACLILFALVKKFFKNHFCMKSLFSRFAFILLGSVSVVCLAGNTYAQTTPGNLVVLQANSAAGSGVAVPVVIVEYNTTTLMQTSSVSSNTLPTGVPALTVSGTAGSDGHISLDSERTHLIVAGYNAVPAVAAVSTTPGINRTIYSIDPAGTATNVADVSQTNCYKTNNFRSATAAGNRYFGGGTGSSATGGVQYMSGSSNTQVGAVPNNLRVVQIFNGQLYFSSATAPTGIYAAGTGIPSVSGTSATILPGITAASPYDFAISPDNNTVFVAVDAAGILKYSRTGGTGTFSGPTTMSAIGCRGLTADFSTTPYTIYATTTFLPFSNALIRLTDIPSPVVDTLAMAPANTFFKGLAFTPAAYAKIQLGGLSDICSGSDDTLKFWANPGDSVTYTVNGVTKGVRVDNTGLLNFNTGALTALNNDSVYTYSLVEVITSLGTTSVSGSVDITVSPATPAPITGAAVICNGGTASLADLTIGGSWSTSSAGVASVNTAGFVTSVGSGSAIITYSLTNACGLISDTALITVHPVHSVSIAPGSATICNGSNTTL